MAKESQARSLNTTSSVEAAIETAFAQLKDLGTADATVRLFPAGLESLNVDVDSGNGSRVSLKIKGNSSEPTTSDMASGVDDVEVRLDTGVHATFNAEGHHVIALIAQQDLNQHSPNTMKKVQKILDSAGRELLAAATFPDDIRMKQPQTKPFHFVDIELEAGGPTNPPLAPPPNVITKIDEFTKLLLKGGTAKDLIDPLSWTIHLFGDIHQPLHCVTRITSAHPRPDGDRGGNAFVLKGHARNLHSLWDSSVSFTPGESEDQIADDIIQQHSRKQLAEDLKVKEVEKWARSSFALAKNFAYKPLNENAASPPKPSAAYLANAQKIGRRQAALAGYRLSDRLRQIFP